MLAASVHHLAKTSEFHIVQSDAVGSKVVESCQKNLHKVGSAHHDLKYLQRHGCHPSLSMLLVCCLTSCRAAGFEDSAEADHSHFHPPLSAPVVDGPPLAPHSKK